MILARPAVAGHLGIAGCFEGLGTGVFRLMLSLTKDRFIVRLANDEQISHDNQKTRPRFRYLRPGDMGI